MSSRSLRWNFTAAVAIGGAAISCALCGCQDGPLYALKHANPYFTMKEWPADEAIGVTDHQRRQELVGLVGSVGQMPAARQRYWVGHLTKLVQHDPSAEMRRLAVSAAGKITAADPSGIIQQGLDDDSVKVRMEACRALGRRPGESAARLLAETAGSATNLDVRHAAMAALGNHENSVAVEALRLALNDDNPATRDLAMESLKGSTGKDYGDDPEVWIAALEGKPVEQQPTRLADQIRKLFY